MPKTITICSSASFYRQVADIQAKLEEANFKVLVPVTAEIMKKNNNYDVSRYKSWFADENDYYKKTELTRGHFDKVAKGDAILVLNYEKNGSKNYIGGSVLMEMGIAFYLNKPIFILNEIPEDSSFIEEIKALQPIVLHGDLSALSIS